MQTQLLITLSEEKRAFFLALLAELDFVEQVQEVLPTEAQAQQEEEATPKTGAIIPPRDFSEEPLTDEEYAKMPKGKLSISEPTPEEDATYEDELAELHDDEYPENTDA
jgi:hypothetical protein